MKMSATTATQTVSIEEYGLLTAHDLYRLLPNMILTGTCRDVWDEILYNIEEGYASPVTRAEIAERLNIDETYVSHATKPLTEAGLIFRRGRESVWYVNPQLAFKGSYEDWQALLADLPDDIPEVQAPFYEVRPPRRRDQPRLRAV
ncbi:winged helix-turn-helix domain-containing protein [Nocardiopsis sp. NPDC006198]|uniref:winged helix-turn-helix domain-containing protein n=1 Tax=Nocardiopsis sp. NPDC006198 TaxID=3154472 RepID=UPI0033A85EC4